MAKELLQYCIENCGKLKLLYVEDDKETRENTLRLLNQFFKYIKTAENGAQGIERFQEEEFDCVLTDINMPVLNGLGMIQQIKKINPSISIFVLSAHNETNYF